MERPPLVWTIASATCLVIACAVSCEKDRLVEANFGRGRPPFAVADVSDSRVRDIGDTARAIACGPRGLPPERHFVAEGMCARVVATRQGRLRGITFASTGDLIAVTREGDIKRYRDVDHDGILAPEAPETVVWASAGIGGGHNCHFDGEDLYCGSSSAVKKWRYRQHLDRGGPGEDVVVGMPEGTIHPVGVWEGFLYVASGSVVKRFALDAYVGRPMPWKDGDIYLRGLHDVIAIARGPRGIMGLDGGADDLRRHGMDLHRDVAGQPVAIAFAAELASNVGETLGQKWRSGAFVALHGAFDRDMSTGHKVVWLPADASRAASLPHEIVFGGGRHLTPRDGDWSWRVGTEGEDSVTPIGIAISPTDGALYVASDNAQAEPWSRNGGSIYRIARLGM